MKTTYQGSCHCGSVRFEIDADLDHVRVCDCSICRRRGALIHRVEPEFFRLLTPLEDLALYTFHAHTARDYFCRTCGILPSRRPRTSPDVWGVNVRCLEDVDLERSPSREYTEAIFRSVAVRGLEGGACSGSGRRPSERASRSAGCAICRGSAAEKLRMFEKVRAAGGFAKEDPADLAK